MFIEVIIYSENKTLIHHKPVLINPMSIQSLFEFNDYTEITFFNGQCMHVFDNIREIKEKIKELNNETNR